MDSSDQLSVLVVDSDLTELSSTVSLLRAAGYRVSSASAFEEAKRLIASDVPDLLITDLRLGAFNGLHLVLRTRTDHPAMAAIVTSRYRDPVLEAEAHRQRADFVVWPLPDGELLEAVNRSLTSSRSSV